MKTPMFCSATKDYMHTMHAYPTVKPCNISSGHVRGYMKHNASLEHNHATLSKD